MGNDQQRAVKGGGPWHDVSTAERTRRRRRAGDRRSDGRTGGWSALDRDVAGLREELHRQRDLAPEHLFHDIEAMLLALEQQQSKRGFEAIALMLRRFADQALSRRPLVLGVLALRLESLAHRLEIIAIYRN